MSTLLRRGVEMLNRLAPVAAGIEGTYTRRASAGGGSVSLTTFIAANSDWTSQPAPGDVRVRHDFQTRTIIGPLADLVINGTAFTPDVGDTWTETINGVTHVFKVMDESGHKAVSYSDLDKTRVRIRMKIK